MFPDIDVSTPAYFKAYVAAKSTYSSSFKFFDGNNLIMTGSVTGIPATSDTYARNYIGFNTFLPSSSNLDIKIDYQKPVSSATGWLNYIELNVTRFLKFSGNQMGFRFPQAIASGNIAEFTLSDAGSNVKIWEVTDPEDVSELQVTQNGSNQIFRLAFQQ